MENKLIAIRRVSMALRHDLNERVFQKAEALRQNPNYFANQCIEGILDAMDAGDIAHDIPILKLARNAEGKPMLDAQRLNAICSIFAPGDEISISERRHFAVLVNRHEGELTRELIEFYWKRALEIYHAQIAHEKAVAQLKRKLGLSAERP
jgi:hypothetical protein